MRKLFLALLLAGSPAMASTAAIMHRDPGCGCCEKWAAQVRKGLGKAVRAVDTPNRASLQARYGIPPHLRSCHTALIDGMAFEGHVPIEDMRRVLSSKPRGVTGLAVGGMPLGSPGMEVSGQAPQRFEVYSVGAAGARIYARH
jgi:hypothetical protein